MSPVKRYEKTTKMSVRIPEELAARATLLVAQLKGSFEIHVPGVEEPVKPSIAALLLAGFDDELTYWEQVLAGEIDVDEGLSGRKVEVSR